MTAVARVKELGGETDAPGPDEPGFDFCTCRDPQGLLRSTPAAQRLTVVATVQVKQSFR